MTPFLEAMMLLDLVLTQKSAREVTHTAHNQQRYSNPLDFVLSTERAYYLSDGGYSRVCWNDFEDGLVLASVSRTEVKQRWDSATPERERAEKLIRDAIEEATRK